MDAKTCLQKLQYVGVLAFATVDEYEIRRFEILVRYIMSRMPCIFLQPEERTFVRNCSQMDVYRYLAIRNIRK